MAKRKRKHQHQLHTEEVRFLCLGCYELAQKRLRRAKISFRTSFHGSLFFEQITDEIEAALDGLTCVKADWLIKSN